MTDPTPETTEENNLTEDETRVLLVSLLLLKWHLSEQYDITHKTVWTKQYPTESCPEITKPMVTRLIKKLIGDENETCKQEVGVVQDVLPEPEPDHGQTPNG